MNLKYKIRTYNFWISLASAVLLLLRLIGQRFGFEIDSNAFMDIVTALCGVMVVLGIITMPVTSTATSTKTKSKTEQKTVEDEVKEIVDNMEVETEENVAEMQDAQNEEILEQETAETSQNITNEEQKTESIETASLQEIAAALNQDDTKDALGTISKNLKLVLEDEEASQLFKEALENMITDPEQLVSMVETLLKEDE